MMANFKFKFIWTIENFSILPVVKGQCLQSPSFNVKNLGSSFLECYPKGNNNEDWQVSINIHCSPQIAEKEITCELSITDGYHSIEASMLSKLKRTLDSHLSKWIFELPQNYISAFALTSTKPLKAVITCEIFSKSSSDVSSLVCEEDMKTLSQDMQNMYDSKQFADMFLHSETTVFPVHKCILRARVPKFLSFVDTVEGNKKEVGDDPEVLKYLLNYAYSGNTSVLFEDVPKKFYSCVDTYELSDLKKKLYFYPSPVQAVTYVKVQHVSFQWTIDRFYNVISGEKAFSPAFSCNGSTFKLRCEISKDEMVQKIQNLEIYVCEIQSSKQKPIFVKCKMTVKTFVTGADSFECTSENVFASSEEWHFPTFFTFENNGTVLQIKKLDKYISLTQYNLCLCCEMSVTDSSGISSDIVQTQYSVDKTNDEEYLHILCKDLGLLYNIYLPKDCDVTLTVTDSAIQFPTHKVILAARSPVFCRMFQCDMLESNTSVVHIPDITVPVLNALLTYIYSARLDLPNVDIAMNLFTAADKYEIYSLKKKCSAYLLKELCLDNVCSILLMAYLHSDEELKTHGISFIGHHPHKVLNLDEWKELVESHKALAIEVLLNISHYVAEDCSDW